MILRRRTTAPADSTADTPGDAVAILERIARDVRTGSSLSGAAQVALHEHPRVLPGVAAAIDDGHTVTTALASTGTDSGTRMPVGEEAMLAQALTIAATAGPAATAALERTAQVLRERRSWALERQAAAAQARLSARVLTVLPVATGAWTLLSSERVRDAFRTSSLPMIAVASGVLLDVIGWWWMRRLVGVPARIPGAR